MRFRRQSLLSFQHSGHLEEGLNGEADNNPVEKTDSLLIPSSRGASRVGCLPDAKQSGKNDRDGIHRSDPNLGRPLRIMAHSRRTAPAAPQRMASR